MDVVSSFMFDRSSRVSFGGVATVMLLYYPCGLLLIQDVEKDNE